MTLPLRFLFSGTAGIGATLCVHPLDVVRVRLQLDAEGGGKPLYRGGMVSAMVVLASTLPSHYVHVLRLWNT